MVVILSPIAQSVSAGYVELGEQTRLDHGSGFIIESRALIDPDDTSITPPVNSYSSGWGEDIRLTYADEYSIEPRVLIDSNDIIYVVWQDDRDGDYNLYLKRSTDYGNTWSSDIKVTDTINQSGWPRIALDSNDTLHLLWLEEDETSSTYKFYPYDNDYKQILYKNSGDGGGTWSSEVRIASNTGRMQYCGLDIAVGEDDAIHVSYSKYSPSRVYHIRSTDGGNSWSTPLIVGNDIDCARPTVIAATSLGHVYIAFHSWGNTGDVEFAKSDDNGATWESTITLLGGYGWPSRAHLAATDDGHVFLTYVSNRHGADPWSDPRELYIIISDDYASSWGSEIRLSHAGYRAEHPVAIIDSENNVNIVWQDIRDGNWEMYYTKLDSHGNTLIDDMRLTDDPANTGHPVIATDSNDDCHVYWQDNRIAADNYEIFYKGEAQPPVADAGSDQIVNEGDVVELDGSASYVPNGTIETFEWDFESDGIYVYQETRDNAPDGGFDGKTTHIYGDNGVFTVTLRVTDDNGLNDTDTCNITVRNVLPFIDSITPLIVNEGDMLTLSAHVTDPGSDDLNFTWDWGYAGFSDTINIYLNDPPNFDPQPSPEINPMNITDTVSQTYGDNGVFTVTLKVKDDDGGRSYVSTSVTVNNLAPITEIDMALSGDEGDPVILYILNTDQGSDDMKTQRKWGDGTGDFVSFIYNNGFYPDPYPSPDGKFPFTSQSWVPHIYGDDGIYSVTVIVEDDDGSYSIYEVNTTINNIAPEIGTISTPDGDEGTTIIFSSEATDPGSDDLIFRWNWGDGTPDTITVYYNDGVNPDPYQSPWGTKPFTAMDTTYHTYGDNGVYTVTLTVEDDDGDATTFITNLTINNVDPTIHPLELFAVDEGIPFILSANSTDQGTDDLTFTWEFELGPTITNVYYNNGVNPDPYPSPWGTYPFSAIGQVIHTYSDNGVFTFTIIVEDDDGGTTSYTANLTVYNVAPTIEPFGPFTVDEGSPVDLIGIGTDLGSDDLTFTWEFDYGPTYTNVFYNDGADPDPYTSPWGIYPFSASDDAEHAYCDNGVFGLTLTVEDDDGGATAFTTNITVDNVAPVIEKIGAYMYANISLRVAGEKYHSVDIFLYKDGSEIEKASVTRYPGDPDEQMATITNVKMDMTKSYTAIVDYLPNDPRVNGNVWGANPVWIIMTFADGSETRLHHTFNVRKSYWNSDHWNHIDPWEVELNPLLIGLNITFEASVEDPGSDDLTFTWEWGDGTPYTEMIYYNDGSSPDPYPSPWGIYPFTATDVQKHIFSFTGNYIVTLTAKDDDGGIITMSLDIDL